MSKLQKYNRIVFAIISIPTLIVICLLAYILACETIFRSEPEYDMNNGSISQTEAEKNSKKKEDTQYISYNSVIVLNPEKQEFVIPVIARTMEKPARRFSQFGFYESSVSEVVFEEASTTELSTVSTEETNEASTKRIHKPDTAFLKKHYTEQFINLVYESDAGKIHRTIMEKRFTGWNLGYICNGKKRYLAFTGTETDSNKDGFINQEDNSDFYLYDIDLNSMKVVPLPNKTVDYFYLIKNTATLILAVRDQSHSETRKNETMVYRYDLNTGILADIIPDEEKARHLQLIQ
ncbi:MAG: hypothetical protein HUK20_12230 [Fibrobacter sp.]|nr:hypothetical protein [Fibrobacter sp.]